MGLVIFYQHETIKNLNDVSNLVDTKTDTIYVNDTITLYEEYDNTQPPKELVIYKKDTVYVPYKEVIVKNDTVILISDKLDSLKISKWYLLQHPGASKLLSLEVDNNELNFQLLPIDGNPVEKRYKVNFDKYKYVYVDNELTFKKRNYFQIYPSIEYKYRFLHKLHDMDLSLNFKTNKFTYMVGLNCFSYYNLGIPFGYDAEIGVRYNFR